MKLLLVMLFALPAAAAIGQRITLVAAGRSDYRIVVAPDAAPAVRFGAEELQRFLREMSGADLPIVTEDPAGLGAGEHVIIVRSDPRLSEEELTVRTEPPRLVIAGGGQRGALYGCYAFLEDVLGCRWYTASISKIPKSPNVRLNPLDMREKPAFEYREPYCAESFDKLWAARNRTNGNSQHLDASVGGRVQYGKGAFVHTFNELVPPDEYFDKHPEYFSMINGKRMKGYYQLCLTNPDVVKIAIARVEEWIRANPDATIFSVSQNDTGYYCQCPQCEAVIREEGAPSGLVLRFVNEIAAAVARKYPRVLIDTLAYQWSEAPPKHVRPLPNVRIRLAPIGACVAHGVDRCDANRAVFANLEAWSRITRHLYVWHYCTNFANYLQPLPDLDEIANDIPLFKKNGVVGIFYQGDYAPGGGGDFSELKAYLIAKLLWDADRPAQPIISDFLQGVYGPAAPYIQQWIDVLYKPVRTQNVHAFIYDSSSAAYLSPATLKEGDRLFAEAERAASNDPVALEEVRKARLALEYVEFMQTAPRFAVQGSEYSPVMAGGRAEAARKLIAGIERFGITQVREGEPLDNFVKRIGHAPAAYPLLTLENDTLTVDVVPDLGGRIVRLIDQRTGRNLLREADPHEGGYPAAGGYEEYTGGTYRSAGWHEPYTNETGVAAPPGQAVVATKLADGLEVRRTFELDGAALRIRTVVTNGTPAPLHVALRGHPEFAPPAGATDRVVFTDRSGKNVSQIVSGPAHDIFFSGGGLPDGSWTLEMGADRITETFDPAQVSQVVLNGSPSDVRINLEIFGIPQTLGPGQSTTLEQTWRVSAGDR